MATKRTSAEAELGYDAGAPAPWEVGLKSGEEEQARLNSLRLAFNAEGRLEGGRDGRWSDVNFATRTTSAAFLPARHAAALVGCTLSLMDEGAEDDDEDAPDVDPSFWMPAEAEPCSMHEVLAQAIFRAHTAGVEFDPASSGAEWWFVVREPRDPATADAAATGSSSSSSSDDDGGGGGGAVAAAAMDDGIVDHDGGDAGIAFHFDKDVMLAGLGLPFVHPQLSTVTYLTSAGAPTVVFPLQRSVEGAVDAACNAMTVSHPCAGKHLVFDGKSLHGVPESLARGNGAGAANDGSGGGGGSSSSSSGSYPMDEPPRVTFLVNIWLNHPPFGVQRFPFGDFPSARATMPPQADTDEIRQTVADAIAAASRRYGGAGASAAAAATEDDEDVCTISDIAAPETAPEATAAVAPRCCEWELRVTVDSQERSAADDLVLRVPAVPPAVSALPDAAVVDGPLAAARSSQPSTFSLHFQEGHGPVVVKGS